MPPNPYRRQPNINDMMYPKGSKQPRQVWAAVMNVYKEPPSTTPTTPTPTPSITASPTVTPTPTVTIGLTPTATETQTPTPTNTPTNTATQTGTPSVTSSPTSTPTQTQSGTPQVTSSPTNTPTQTQTGTPSVTSTPTSTPTQTQTGTLAVTSTPTPSPTPTAFTGYGYNLVTTPYNPPSSGNTIFTNLSLTGATSGITNPNTFDVNGVYWSIIDRTGTDTTSYFSGITGTSFQVSFYQNGQTAIYSGLTDTIQYDDQPSLTDSFFYSPNQRPGQLTLVQSASTNFSTSLPVYINWIGNILPTPSPTPTNTNTPTNTQTPSVTPTNTGTPVTPTPTNTNSPTPTNTLTPTPSSTPPAKLLDAYPNAYIAVSTRKLRTAYAGSAVRIRRDSDTTQTDVGFDANGDINVSTINTFCSGTGCSVVTWYDQSGNARNLTADPFSAPKIYLSGSATTINNKVSPYFNGGNSIGVGGLAPGSVSLASWFNLGYRTGGSNPAYIIGMNPGNKIELANTLGIVDAGQTVGTFGTAFSTGLTQSSILRQSGNSKAFINGTQSSTTNTAGLTNLTSTWSLALGVNNETGGEYWLGYLPEWVLYIASDQSSNRAGIESNQKAYWGTP
jgi:hypothetical protein